MNNGIRGRTQRFALSILLALACQLALATSAMTSNPAATPLASSSAGSSVLTARDMRMKPLRGFNLGKPPAIVRPAGDFVELANSGAKLVRVMLNLSRCEGCSEFGMAPRDMEYLGRVVDEGASRGFKVIINLAPQPGGARADYWDDGVLKASIKKHWLVIAKTYKGNPVVAGYDLVNEPNPLRKYPLHGGALWRDFAEELITAIRKVDPDHLIVFEPAPGALPKGFDDLVPLPFDNVAYSVHFYEPHQLTHQGLPGFEGAGEYPGSAGLLRGRWDKDRLRQSLEPVRRFAQRYSVPIYVGEFSFIRSAPNDSAYRYVRDAISLFENEGWSWTYHAFRESPEWDAELPPQTPRNVSRERRSQERTPNAPLIKLLSQCFHRPEDCR